MTKNINISMVMAIFLFLSTVGGCASSADLKKTTVSDPRSMSGKYSFQMTDSTGAELCEGELVVSMTDSVYASGTITINKIHRENFTGLSAIGKKVEGQYYKQTGILSLDANPVVTDNNVFINVKPDARSLAGTWSYSTFAGVKNKGIFKAVKM